MKLFKSYDTLVQYTYKSNLMHKSLLNLIKTALLHVLQIIITQKTNKQTNQQTNTQTRCRSRVSLR